MKLMYQGAFKSVVVESMGKYITVKQGEVFECEPKIAATLCAKFNRTGAKPSFIDPSELKNEAPIKEKAKVTI